MPGGSGGSAVPCRQGAGGAAVPAPAGKPPSARGSAGPGKRFFSFSTKFGSIGYNRNRTERTEPEISQFLVLKRTERFLFFRNRTSLRTEEPNRSVRLEPNAQPEPKSTGRLLVSNAMQNLLATRGFLFFSLLGTRTSGCGNGLRMVLHPTAAGISTNAEAQQ